MSQKEDRTQRATAVPLTPGEARAFARIARGSARPPAAASRDVQQLKKLRLVEEVGGVLRLTVIGQDLAVQLSQADALAAKSGDT